MNYGQLFMMVSLSSALMAAGSILACLALAWKLRDTKTRQQVLATDVDSRLSELRKKLDLKHPPRTPQQEAFEFEFGATAARFHIAPQLANGPVSGTQPGFSNAVRDSFTERRHRILRLAQRGLDIKTIATRLGVPLGEVALIIRMSNPGIGE